MKILMFYNHWLYFAKWCCSIIVILIAASLVVAQPINNSCATAIALNCNSTITSSNVGASDDSLPSCGLLFPGQTVWYTLTGTGGLTTVSTCNPGTDFNTEIGVFTGSCGSFTCVTGNVNDNSCQDSTAFSTVSWNSIENETYYIVIGGLITSEGDFELSIDCEFPPENNTCADAIDILCNDEEINGTNVDATSDSLATCGMVSPNAVVWYTLTGTGGDITATTCNSGTDFDSQLGIFTGTCGNLTCVAGNNNDGNCTEDSEDATVTWSSTAGVTYYLVVAGNNGNSGNFELTITRHLEPSICNIYCISVDNRSDCDSLGTIDYQDDIFTADVRVRFTSLPASGNLEVVGPGILSTESVPVSSIDTAATFYKFIGVTMRADGMAMDITASFTADTTCTLHNDDVGDAKKQCSVCDNDLPSSSSVPQCWPKEDTLDHCTKATNYAPDPDFPELTPIRYVQVVLHFFQLEDPDSLGQWVVNPDTPGNFTIADTNLIRSWFTDSLGVNWALKNLCDDTTDTSPHMTDARIEFLNRGIVGSDIFFHPDNRGWGIGYKGCISNSAPYYGTAIHNYITSPASGNPDSLALMAPETRNAFHVFLSGGKWSVVDSTGMLSAPGPNDVPDADDCYYFGPGAFTTSMTNCPDRPAQASYSWYSTWIEGQQDSSLYYLVDSLGQPLPGTTEDVEYPGSDAAIGQGILGEFFHVMSVDHISPLQAHITPNDDDGCEDTPWDSPFNRLGCDYNTRCALSECQIGRMHRFFAESQPSFERFPDGNGGFSMTRSCDVTESDITIPDGADIVWNGPRYPRSNVIIESGGSLTITCDVGMPHQASFFVESGGKLIVDGGRIFSCDSTSWEGIIVDGNPNLSQVPNSNQGYVELNNATIEYAETGVSLSYLYAYGGGIIKATNTNFYNCQQSIVFAEYENFLDISPPRPFWNLSYFRDCTFTVDDDYTFSSFTRHVWLNGVSGITFLNSSFKDTRANVSQESMLGTGIDSYDAHFVVTNSAFDSLRFGIKAQSISSAKSFSVRSSSFKDNHTGISARAVNNFTIADSCHFSIGGFTGTITSLDHPLRHVGVFIDNSTGFMVEDNVFTESSNPVSGLEPIGICARDVNLVPGPEGTETPTLDYNEIFKNTFSDLLVANLANGNNRGDQFEGGLTYLCNNNISGNGTDFLVFEGKIAANQRDLGGFATGNAFSHDGGDAAFSDINNSMGSDIDYYYYSGNADEIPGDSLIDESVNPISENQNFCISELEEGDIPEPDIPIVISECDSLKQSYLYLKGQYDSLLDGGDTETTLNTVNAVTYLTAASVKSQLLGYSPYLSQQVIEAIVDNTIFSSNDKTDILEENPEVIKRTVVSAYIEDSGEFSQAQLDSLAEASQQTTARKTSEEDIAVTFGGLQWCSNRLIRNYQSDSTDLSFDSVRYWLGEKLSMEGLYGQVESWLDEKDTTEALNLLLEIDTSLELSSAQLTEFSYYVDLKELRAEIIGSGRSYFELDTSEISQLQNIANYSRDLAGLQAENWLNLAYSGTYQNEPLLPTGSSLSTPELPMPDVVENVQPRWIKAYPNPVTELATFEINFPKSVTTGNLIIVDINGRIVKNITVTLDKSIYQWDTKHAGEGIYYYRLITDQGESNTYKLAIIK